MLLICDFAEVINDKLYVQGGGIDRVVADVPVSLSLAVVVPVSWNDTNRRQNIRLELRTSDGHPYPPGPDDPGTGPGAVVEGSYEVGRPPGSAPGMSFLAKLAIRLPFMIYARGTYEWRLVIEDQSTDIAHIIAG